MLCLFGCVDLPDDLKHYARCPVLWRVISSCDRLPLSVSVLEIITITEQIFHNALRLVVACNACHTFKHSSSLSIVSLFRQGVSLEIEKVLGEDVRRVFTSALSRPDLRQHAPNKFMSKHVLNFPVVDDRCSVTSARV